jgi:hypothetical protein
MDGGSYSSTAEKADYLSVHIWLDVLKERNHRTYYLPTYYLTVVVVFGRRLEKNRKLSHAMMPR